MKIFEATASKINLISISLRKTKENIAISAKVEMLLISALIILHSALSHILLTVPLGAVQFWYASMTSLTSEADSVEKIK